MDDEDDLLAELEALPVADEPAAAAPAAPRRGYSRTLELAPIDVVGDPNGRRGTSTMGDPAADRVIEGAKLPPTRIPTSGGATSRSVSDEMERRAVTRGRQQELERRGRRDEQHSPMGDALSMWWPGFEDTRAGIPQQRTAQRVSEAWGDFVDNPAATATAAAGGALRGPFGVGDEMLAGGADLWQRTARALGDDSPLIPPEELQRGIRRGLDQMRSGNPYVSDTSRDVAGALPWLAAGPETAVARVVGGTGGGVLAGVGARDAETPEDILDAGIEALPYAAAGSVAGEAPRALGRAVSAMGAGRDDALLAATGRSGASTSTVRRFDYGDTPEQIRRSHARSAEVLRETNAIPRLGTMTQTAQSIDRAMEIPRSTMRATSTAMEGGGASRADIARRLREASQADRTVAGEGYRAVLDDFAAGIDDAGDAVSAEGGPYRAPVTDASPFTYDDLTAEAGRLRQLGSHRTRAGRDVGVTEEARRDIERLMRDAFDDSVEGTLGVGEREAYQRARQQYATLRNAQLNAGEGLSATANNHGFGPMEAFMGMSATGAHAAGGGGGMSMATGLGAAAAMRVFRAVGPRARASASEYAYRIAQASPQFFGRRAQALLDAGTRGPAALAAAHHVLTQTDAEYRQRLAELEALEVAEEDATPDAIRRIGESGGGEP